MDALKADLDKSGQEQAALQKQLGEQQASAAGLLDEKTALSASLEEQKAAMDALNAEKAALEAAAAEKQTALDALTGERRNAARRLQRRNRQRLMP